MTNPTGATTRRRALLVVGMHRSGTSALTRVLGLLGAGLPRTLLPANEFNPSGYWESNVLTELHDELLAAAGSSWLDLSPFPKSWFGSDLDREFQGRIQNAVATEYGSAELIVVKDPRIVKFLPVWLSALERIEVEPVFLMPYRHPFEVAASLEQRDQLPLTHSLLLWLHHVVEAEHKTRRFPRAAVSFDALLTDWRAEIGRLGGELDLDWPSAIAEVESEVDSFLSAKLRHHRSAAEDLGSAEPGGLFDLAKRAYELLERDELGNKALPAWDVLRHQAESAADSKQAPLGDTKVLLGLQKTAGRLRLLLAERDAQLGESRAELEEKSERVSTQEAAVRELRERVRSRDEEIREIKDANQELLNELISVSNGLAEARGKLESVFQSQSWRFTAPLRGLMAAFRGGGPPVAALPKREQKSATISSVIKEKLKGVVRRSPRAVRDPLTNFVRSRRRPALETGPDSRIGPELESALPCITRELEPGDRYEEESDREIPQTDIKPIAFYLPQFHPFPENDEFWGKGFTEWTNTTKAQPEFEGHYQPRVPDELGYYDLRLASVHERQIELAKRHGIHGFCYHHYWFSGRRLMRIPLERHLERLDFDFPFCLHWANEPWTRSWDGLEGSRTLLGQEHSPEDDLAFIRDIEPALRDERYIRVDGKPLFLLYRPGLFPDIRATVDRWQEHCVRSGIGELHLAVLQQGFDGRVDPREFGFAAAVEFPPHNISQVDARSAVDLFDPEYPGYILSYPHMVSGSLAMKPPNYPLYRGLVPAWDCTARRRAATLFVGSTPELYGEWLEGLCRYTREHLPESERFVFINAWNEWAEGTYLEPDTKYGYAYLNRTGEALEKDAAASRPATRARKFVLLGHDAARLGAQNLLLHIARWLATRTATDVRIVLGEGGEMVPDFEKIASVLVLDRVRGEHKTPDAIARSIAEFVGDDADLIFVNSAASGKYLPFLKFLGAPVVSYVHELENSLEKFCTPESVEGLIEASARVVSSSRAVEANLVDRHGVTPEQTDMVSSFIEHGSVAAEPARREELRKSLGLEPSTVAVFGCGTRDWRKGPDIFVDVASRLLERRIENFRFFWIGPPMPGEYESLEASLEERGLSSHVTFLGAQPNCELFGAGDIFLLSSREDPSPLVCHLAAECRLPTVCFADSGGAPAFVGDDGGVVVPFEDADAMAEVVGELIGDRRQRTKLGRAAERNYLERYTTDARMPELFHVMRTVAESPPAVSVIVPSYNYAQYLERRMASVLKQTFQDFEVIVEDDCSTDETLEMLLDYDRHRHVTVVTHETNAGAFTMWLEGLRAAASDLIWIAEEDDYCEPELLETLVPFFADEKVKLAYVQSHVVDGNDNYLGDYSRCFPEFSDTKWLSSYVVPGEQELADGLAVKNTILNASAVVFRKPPLGVMDEIMEGFKLSGDWYLYLNVLADGNVAYSPRKLNYHRRHESSIIAQYGDKDVAVAELGRIHAFVLETYELESSVIEQMVGYAFEIWSKENPVAELDRFWAEYGLDLPEAEKLAALESLGVVARA